MTTCNHALANGERCNAPALNNCSTCRHHDPSRPHPQSRPRSPEYQPLELPPLTDKHGILSAIVEVIHAISERRIKRSEGGTLLFGLQMASNLMTELDQMPRDPEEEYDSSAEQHVNSPGQISKLEHRRERFQAAGINAYVPTQQDMQGFMTGFECANAKKLAERIAAKRNAWEKQRAMSLASRIQPASQRNQELTAKS